MIYNYINVHSNGAGIVFAACAGRNIDVLDVSFVYGWVLLVCTWVSFVYGWVFFVCAWVSCVYGWVFLVCT